MMRGFAEIFENSKTVFGMEAALAFYVLFYTFMLFQVRFLSLLVLSTVACYNDTRKMTRLQNVSIYILYFRVLFGELIF